MELCQLTQHVSQNSVKLIPILLQKYRESLIIIIKYDLKDENVKVMELIKWLMKGSDNNDQQQEGIKCIILKTILNFFIYKIGDPPSQSMHKMHDPPSKSLYKTGDPPSKSSRPPLVINNDRSLISNPHEFRVHLISRFYVKPLYKVYSGFQVGIKNKHVLKD